MKKYSKVLLAGIVMAIGFGFISCNDEEINEGTQIEALNKIKVEIDARFKDNYGNTWHIVGWVDVIPKTLTEPIELDYINWDITLTNETTGESYHFTGVSEHSDGKITSLEGHLYNEKGEEVSIEKEIPDLENILNECANNYLL